ncbi:MAG: dockerin type I repeat-containing protein [Oscillospiraceae bacterium]|nr:dockerin type I repeat-containing protein [Oscillospiraceae bacterium]
MSPITTFWQSRDTAARQILTNWLGSAISQQTVTAKVNQSSCDVQFNTIKLGNSSFTGTYNKSEPMIVKVTAPEGNHAEEPSVSGGTVIGGDAVNGYIIQPDDSASTVEITVKYAAGEVTIAQPGTTAPAVTTTAPKTNGVRGDVNNDGKVTVSDAVLLSRVLAEDTSATLTEQGKENADVNNDGNLTPEDNTKILKSLAGLDTL